MTRTERMTRESVLYKRMRAEGHKADAIVLAYGGSAQTDDGKLLAAGWRAELQRAGIKHTTQGDFSHLHANPLIFK